MTPARALRRLVPLALVALPLGAQSPATPPPAFEERLEVAEALVDVLVTDRDGNVVLGLGPADFEVREGGTPVEVIGATFYSNRRFLDAAGAAKLGIDPAAVPDQRLYVLLFDDQASRGGVLPELVSRQLRAGRDAAEWIRDGLLSGDRVAVLGYRSSLALQQDFTADRELLARAVDRAARGAAPPPNWRSRAVAPGAGEPALADALPADLVAASTRFEKAVATLARALEPIPGRKNLVVFTSGFGEATGLHGGYTPEQQEYRRMVESLNAANVAAYVVDLVPVGIDHPLESSISRLAADTGGRPFFDLLEFSQPLVRVAETTNGYYLVAFRSPHPRGRSGYSPIEVRVANPEFRVTAREGYRWGE